MTATGRRLGGRPELPVGLPVGQSFQLDNWKWNFVESTLNVVL